MGTLITLTTAMAASGRLETTDHEADVLLTAKNAAKIKAFNSRENSSS
jgi:hypothetical protein